MARRPKVCGRYASRTVQTFINGQALLPHERDGPYSSRRRQTAVDAVSTLHRLGLSRRDIGQIIRWARWHAGAMETLGTWPSKGGERAAILTIQRASTELAAALAAITPRTSTPLRLEIGRQLGAESADLGHLQLLLLALNAGCDEAAKRVTGQDQRRSHPEVVQRVVAAFAGHDIAISDAPKSQFHRACSAVFKLLGIPGAPTGSIRAYMKLPTS